MKLRYERRDLKTFCADCSKQAGQQMVGGALMVGMGLRSYFSDLLFTMMCAIYGSCPARVDIHRPNVLEDDGNWHYADRRTDPRLAAAAWRALRLSEGLFTNS